MSTAFTLAGVSAVLRKLFDSHLRDSGVAAALGTRVEVTVRSPDRLVIQEGSSQLNLFLHHVGQSAQVRRAPVRHPAPPLATLSAGLDLHYLISAHASQDFHAEILLGHAIGLLHEHPIVSGQLIRSSLFPQPPIDAAEPPALEAVAKSEFANGLVELRITPEALSRDDLARVWLATRTSARPSVTYQVTVVFQETPPR